MSRDAHPPAVPEIRSSSRSPSTSKTPWTAEQWSGFLSSELGYPVEVVYTRARRQVVQSRWRGKTADLRLSRIFATAPPAVRDDFARWMRVGRRARKACERLDLWIEEAVAAMPARRARVRTRGEVHDLARLAEDVHTQDFPDEPLLEPRPSITWGRRSGARAVHSLRLGSYTAPEHLVRIHPILDQAAVPDWFVRYIVFHELLHVVRPPRPSESGRLLRHPPEFHARERAYPDFERALAWQREHLSELLRSARSGKPMRATRASKRIERHAPPAAPRRTAAATAKGLLEQLRFWGD